MWQTSWESNFVEFSEPRKLIVNQTRACLGALALIHLELLMNLAVLNNIDYKLLRECSGKNWDWKTGANRCLSKYFSKQMNV